MKNYAHFDPLWVLLKNRPRRTVTNMHTDLAVAVTVDERMLQCGELCEDGNLIVRSNI